MVYRIYVEKKKELANQARSLLNELVHLLGIKNLEDVRILNRYDAEGLDEEIFKRAIPTVFSEPQTDIVYDDIDDIKDIIFAVEYLPGQFDQRADSAAQCIQFISKGNRPLVRSATVYVLKGNLTVEEIAAIKKYVINPVEAREASLSKPDTIAMSYDVPSDVKVIDNFLDLSEDELRAFIKDHGLAMDFGDICFTQEYFKKEKRNPTITEIKMIDTYWSDHCRHTTFGTIIDKVTFEDELLQKTYEEYLETRKKLGRSKPICLMDLGTLAAKYLKSLGLLDKLDESEEINACTVKIEVEADGKKEPWLLLFKNETHNHPTEIEPFGGAATCIGGAIRDPLSGRSYVYGAMRVTGAADPTVPVANTIPGKLPQRKIVQTAAAGYSSYGNQIGLATGIVDEIYHPGYAAKRMEIGAVIAATPAENVRRETPLPGDVIILLGGATGRDGVGGATGSSKAHDVHSVETCGAEVQKGNAPEERKLQRLFRNGEACRMIKRCNDFGAGGVSVAIGELADGLDIDLNAVPKKYEGLDGTELAISESQERMAVVVEEKDIERFMAIAKAENLSATVVAKVKEEPRLRMTWNGKTIVDISREFLNSNGAEKHIEVIASAPKPYEKKNVLSFEKQLVAMANDLNLCSKRGLSERFDSTIGAGTVLMPFGGKYQLTPIQAMVQKISMEEKHTDDCSLMSWGYNPFISEASPYHGAYLAVVESLAKLIATGANRSDTYLSFQEYFEKPMQDGRRWGKPFSAVLGAFKAQLDLGIGAIGGKDSMSGSFEKLDVPPTLVSFAVTTAKTSDIVSPEFKGSGHKVILLEPEYDENNLPKPESLKAVFDEANALIANGKALSAYALGMGGILEAVFKMAIGNGYGFDFGNISEDELSAYKYGSILLECTEDSTHRLIGTTTDKKVLAYKGIEVCLSDVIKPYEDKLEDVYNCNIKTSGKAENISSDIRAKILSPLPVIKPRVLIPVFPGTNCEFDSAKAVRDAGGEPEIVVINNLNAQGIKESVDIFANKLKNSQMIFIPGGFSGGDEPDGSGKFITAFFRNEAIKDGVEDLMDHRGGLICGICNGFQALIKLGLVPYGKIVEMDDSMATLTFNTIGRHQSKIVRTRIASNLSPWLAKCNVGDIYNVPISHGEGRFLANDELLKQLIASGQVATQYVDLDGNATMDIQYNPNGSVMAIEGITSPDGRVFGKMGHSERIGKGLYKNVPGNYDIRMFEAAVDFFKKQ